MLAHDDFELLQKHHDGELLPADVARVEALLAGSPEARSVAAALNSLDEGLETTGAVEPPERAIAEIMARVQAMPHPRQPGWRSLVRNAVARAIGSTVESVTGQSTRVEGSMASRSKIVWGISTAAVVILAGLWMTGVIPPEQEGGDAAIGAAKRYQAPQIAGKDVALGDTEAQAFMQSETFDRILKDPETRKLLNSAEFRQFVADAQISAAMQDEDFVSALRQISGDANLARLFSNSRFGSALSRGEVRAALLDVELQNAMAEESFEQAFNRPEVRAAFSDSTAQAAFNDEDLMLAFSKAGIQDALR